MGKAGGLPQSEAETAAEAATVREGAGFWGRRGVQAPPYPRAYRAPQSRRCRGCHSLAALMPCATSVASRIMWSSEFGS